VNETQSATVSKLTELLATNNKIVTYLHSAAVCEVVNHYAILLDMAVYNYSLPLAPQAILPFSAVPLHKNI